jgi:hypothetical protein
VSKKAKKIKSNKLKEKRLAIRTSPLLIGAMSLAPFFVVSILFGFAIYKFMMRSPQTELVNISFDDDQKVAFVARIMLEGDDTKIAKMIYSKMIDGVNLSSNESMSSDWTDDMILKLNPRSGLSEDIRTKTLMSQSIKSKVLYERLSKLFAQLGFEDKAREFENMAREIDPTEN